MDKTQLTRSMIRAMQAHKQLIDIWSDEKDTDNANRIKAIADKQKEIVHTLQLLINDQ